jgi:PRD1 phage membrane DNA delivery
MNAFMEGLISIVAVFAGVAIVSVLVSNKSQTAGLIQAGASGIGNDLGVAESPVTGANISYSLGYPAANSLSSAFSS